MAYDEKLVARIRESLSALPDVEEKKMFSGICFMVNGKMCVCAGQDEMLCRVGPARAEKAAEQDGCREMIMNGKVMKGYIFVSQNRLQTQKEFDSWISLSLAFNDEAKASPKKKKKNKTRNEA